MVTNIVLLLQILCLQRIDDINNVRFSYRKDYSNKFDITMLHSIMGYFKSKSMYTYTIITIYSQNIALIFNKLQLSMIGISSTIYL